MKRNPFACIVCDAEPVIRKTYYVEALSSHLCGECELLVGKELKEVIEEVINKAREARSKIREDRQRIHTELKNAAAMRGTLGINTWATLLRWFETEYATTDLKSD
jgi:protein-arginine kinase